MLVYVCHPYRDDPALNRALVAEICRKVTARGDVPVPPQLYLYRYLDERKPAGRAEAMRQCLALLRRCDAILVCCRYGDRHLSDGQKDEVRVARAMRLPRYGMDTYEKLAPTAKRGAKKAAAASSRPYYVHVARKVSLTKEA